MKYFIDNVETPTIHPPEIKTTERKNIGLSYDGTAIILLNRKSRIIMKDFPQIMSLSNKLKKLGYKKIALASTAPVCSKTARRLNEENIAVKQLVAVHKK